MCEELINIVLFYASAHRKVNKSSHFLVLRYCVRWETHVKLTQLISVTFKNRPQNALKYMFQFIGVANNICIHVNKREI